MKAIFAVVLFLCFHTVIAQDTLNIPQIKKRLQGITNTQKKLEITGKFLVLDSVKLTKTSEAFIRKNFELALKEKMYSAALLRVNILNQYYIFESLEQEKSFALSKRFYKYIQACDNKKQKARFYINYAEAATYLQKFRQSLNILNKGIAYLEKQKDSSLRDFGYAYLKAGENSTKINSISESAQYFKKASDLFNFQKDTLFYLWTQNGLSALFSSNGLYDEAETARKPIYKLGKLIKQKQVVAMAHVRAAIDASIQGNNKKELKHINLALKNSDSKSDVSGIVNILTHSFAVGTYARLGNVKLSNKYLATLNKTIGKNKISAFLNSYYTTSRAYNAFANKKYELAKSYVNSIINEVKKSQDVTNLMRLEKLLANINEAENQNKKALVHYKKYIHIKDSVDQNTSRKRFDYVQSTFDAKKKDMEIAKQQKNVQLLSAKNKIKNQWLFFGGIAFFAFFTIVYLFRSRKFSQRKAQLQEVFAQDLISNVEDERKRISSELHDSVGQSLLLIKNSLFLNTKKQPETKLINETIDEVRAISQRLHPFQFEKLGLIASIKDTVESFQKNSEIFYSDDINLSEIKIANDKQIFVYRMIQECLHNVEKHSKAIACHIKAEETLNAYLFQIKDNGIGFGVTQNSQLLNSLGMKTLKERAQIIGAQLEINSVKGKGTSVSIKIPKI